MHRHAICWLNGELLPAAQATLSVLDHGLLYGDGIFEGIRFYNRHAFRLDAHLDRLELSARAIALQIPYGRDALIEAIARTIAAFEEPDGYLRLVVTRGVGPMGLNPRGCGPATLFIVADQLSLTSRAVREEGARLIIAATQRLPPNGLDPRIKSLNYLNHILARIEANHAGVDEAVLLNGAGRVAEGTAENLFVVRDGALLTPPTTEGALDGITRQCIIEVAVEAGIPVCECPLAPYDLYTADECFLTGTAAELIPVRDIGGRPMTQCPGQLFLSLQDRFAALVERETGSMAADRSPHLRLERT